MYHIGDIVQVNNGRTGKVVDVQAISDGASPERQQVQVRLPDGRTIDGPAENFQPINVLKKS